MSRSCGGRLDGGGDALIAAATANIAAHRVVDLVLGRVLCRRKERCGLHDLADLTVAALRHVEGAPSLLDRVIAVAIEAFDRGHRAARDIIDGGDAGSGGFAVDMNGACAAERHAAAVFRSREPQFVPQIPEERHRWITVERLLLAVDSQLDHSCPPYFCT